jgi:hypothetical protein
MTDILSKLAAILPVAVTSVIALLAVIAPLTKSDYDNKALDFLRYIEDKFLSILFPGLTKAADPK